ncbi:MAG TPA: VWA domain-containing protein [Terracidiphilus sp.]|nr:VWA domain-containing protein [Terracidiphilus sp.]
MVKKCAAILLSTCSIPVLSAQALDHVAISQVVSTPPSLRSYLDVQGAKNAPVADLPMNAVEGWLDGKSLPVQSVKSFSAAQEGVTYIFLVDVSGSESHAEFARVKQALLGFVGQMGGSDRAAVVSFGTDVRDAAEFTGDKSALKSAISGLANNAAMTHLNAAIVEGLRLARIADPSLPARRCIVILSDGKDEGSGLTTDDVLSKFEDGRIPIYAIGASSLPGSQRAEYLEVLHRFAVLSGGAYYEATSDTVNSAYSHIHDRIAQVWVADFDCSSCAVDGRSHPLQVRVTLQGQSLADKAGVTLQPGSAASNAQGPGGQPKQWWEQLSWPVYAGAGTVLVLLLAGGIWLAQRKRRAAKLAAADFPSGTDAAQNFVPFTFPQPEPELKSLPDTRPAVDNRPGLKIELIRKENRPGTAPRYAGKLVDQLVIGRSADSSIQLPDGEISGHHCKLELMHGLVLLSDTGSTFGTSVNGVPISTRHKVESGDWVAMGKVEFRIQIQK